MNTHRWASLVEIIDILLDLKLKEGEKNESLQKFLLLLSYKKSLLTIEQKKLIIQIDAEFGIYKMLNEAFLKNHFLIMKNRIDLSKLSGNFYFIIEVDSNKKTHITPIADYKDAENKYFGMFVTNKKSNFVLTYIEKPNYNKISIAYSSYILIKHDYLRDWNSFAKDVIEKGVEDKATYLPIYAELINRNLNDQQELINTEIKEIQRQVSFYHKNLGSKEGELSVIRDWIDGLGIRSKEIDKWNEELLNIVGSKKKNIWQKIFS